MLVCAVLSLKEGIECADGDAECLLYEVQESIGQLLYSIVISFCSLLAGVCLRLASCVA
jgi:hypothetical protein